MTADEDGAERRLATYGTLAPGRANARQLADLAGAWRDGWVRGRLADAGWGAAAGYPGLRLDADADEVAVMLFESAELPAHWARLDAFEGADYRRAITTVRLTDGAVEASIYVLADPPPEAAL
ncbi:MAG: gamma-glutamylcyclotransferase [Pseudomonadota bacterium]